MSGRRGTNLLYTTFISDPIPIGDPVDLGGIDTGKVHCFAGIQYFSDAQGTIEAIPTTGTVAITVQTINTRPKFEATPIPSIDASAPCTVSWAANTQMVRATPTGIDVATHYRLVVTCNET